MLDDLVHIADGDDGDVADFVSKYGMLSVCNEHFLPASHRKRLDAAPVDSPWTCRPIPPERVNAYVTPLSLWRHWARAAGAALRIAARLEREQNGDPTDWLALGPSGVAASCRELREEFRSSSLLREASGMSIFDERSYGDPLTILVDDGDPFDMLKIFEGQGSPTAVDAERANLAFAISSWLGMATVTPSLNWVGTRPDLRLDGGAVFGAIGIRLMLAVSRTDGFSMCMSCGNPYIPKRRPSNDRRNYCHRCGRRAAIRDAAKVFRDKQSKKAGNVKTRKR